MKKEMLIFLFFLLFLEMGCKQHANLLKLSNEIYKSQTDKLGDNMFLEEIYTYRKQIDLANKIKISTLRDTIFALEMFGIQGDLYITYWNKADTISYSNMTGVFKSANNVLYSKYMMRLVSEWNISEIKKEEKVNSNLLPNDTIYATRIIFYKNKYNIECIRFSDFFNLQKE